MARFAFYIHAAPHERALQRHAYALAHTLILEGHELALAFFAGPAVTLGLASADVAGDEWDAAAAWSALPGVERVLCSSAAQRCGVTAALTHPAFRIGGLGEWVTVAGTADKVLQWG